MTRSRCRNVLAAASVLVVATTVLTALAFGPAQHRIWLAISGLVGVAMCMPSLFADPRDLLPALVFSVPPVIALAADSSPTWLIAPLAVLLLVGSELNAFSWESEGPPSLRVDTPRRLVRIAQLAGITLVASLAASLAAGLAWLDSTVAVVAAAGTLAALAWVIFPKRAGSGAGKISPPSTVAPENG